MKRWTSWGSVLVVPAALLLLTACGGGGEGGPGRGDFDGKRKKVAPKTVVETVLVDRDTVVDTLATTSTIESWSEADVIPLSSGLVLSLHKDEGDQVRKGDLLAVLENVSLTAGAERSRAEVARLEQQVRELDRLRSQGAVSQRELEDAQYNLNNALSSNREAVRSAGQTRLVAPFDGVVAQRSVRVGQLASTGTAAFRVVDPEHLRVVASLPERDVSRIEVGQQARLKGAYDEESRSEGQVTRVAPVIDATSGTFRVTIDLDEGQTELRPGQFVSVDVVVDRHEDTLVVPKQALVYENGDPVVYVVGEKEEEPTQDGDDANKGDKAADASGGFSFSFGFGGGDDKEEGEEEAPEETGPVLVAKRTKVELGLVDDVNAEVLSGLEVGAQVIVVGQANLKDGGRVSVVDPNAPKADASDADAEPDADADEGEQG